MNMEPVLFACRCLPEIRLLRDDASSVSRGVVLPLLCTPAHHPHSSIHPTCTPWQQLRRGHQSCSRSASLRAGRCSASTSKGPRLRLRVRCRSPSSTGKGHGCVRAQKGISQSGHSRSGSGWWANMGQDRPSMRMGCSRCSGGMVMAMASTRRECSSRVQQGDSSGQGSRASAAGVRLAVAVVVRAGLPGWQ